MARRSPAIRRQGRRSAWNRTRVDKTDESSVRNDPAQSRADRITVAVRAASGQNRADTDRRRTSKRSRRAPDTGSAFGRDKPGLFPHDLRAIPMPDAAALRRAFRQADQAGCRAAGSRLIVPFSAGGARVLRR